jgi:hypothetical protein
MFHRKFKVTVPEGELKEKLISLISSYEEVPSILNSRALWRRVSAEYPELKGKPCRFEYKGITEELSFYEGYTKYKYLPIVWGTK